MREKDLITGAVVRMYRVPTDAPEADGTIAWDRTTMILVQLQSGGTSGIGYTYGDEAAGKAVQSLLESIVLRKDAWAHGAILSDLRIMVRNSGETAISAMAISAIDNALWDLRARLLDVPLVNLLGRVRDEAAVYGSGGFTSYDDAQLTAQLGGWARDAFLMVKMKVGSDPLDDPRRVRLAREAIGEKVELFVDANGAYSEMQGLELAHQFKEQGVCWFEEPVSADNLTGLRHIRERSPLGMDIAAGEYGYSAWYLKRMIEAEAVTVLQADATRCCLQLGPP